MQKPPTYAVQALQDVVIRASVSMGKSPNGSKTPPSVRHEWIALRAGAERNGLLHVVGIHPASAPDHQPVRVDGAEVVMPNDHAVTDLPKDFFGLYRLTIDPP
jgi:hypothetical protein